MGARKRKADPDPFGRECEVPGCDARALVLLGWKGLPRCGDHRITCDACGQPLSADLIARLEGRRE